MQSVLELELWSPPSAGKPPSSGHALAARCCAELGLPETVVLGLSFVPEAIDVENLKAALLEGELDEEEFQSFCAQESLLNDPTHAESAARFLALSFGQPLAWLHFPHTPSGAAMCRRVVQWARTESLAVVEPSELYCLANEAAVSLWWPTGA